MQSRAFFRGDSNPEEVIEKLAAYEDTGLTPGQFKKVADAVKDGRLMIFPELPQDIKNPLEPLKLESALRSELMKMELRKEQNPKDVSIFRLHGNCGLNGIIEADRGRTCITERSGRMNERFLFRGKRVDVDHVLIDNETAKAFDVLISNGFTSEQYYTAHKYYMREIAREHSEPPKGETHEH